MIDPEQQNAPGARNEPDAATQAGAVRDEVRASAEAAAIGTVGGSAMLQLDHTPGGQPDDLHNLLTSPEGEEDPLAALRDDPNYSALIKELEYIAAQARLLFQPAEEAPSDEVWSKIQSKLPNLAEDE